MLLKPVRRVLLEHLTKDNKIRRKWAVVRSGDHGTLVATLKGDDLSYALPIESQVQLPHPFWGWMKPQFGWRTEEGVAVALTRQGRNGLKTDDRTLNSLIESTVIQDILKAAAFKQLELIIIGALIAAALGALVGLYAVIQITDLQDQVSIMKAEIARMSQLLMPPSNPGS